MRRDNDKRKGRATRQGAPPIPYSRAHRRCGEKAIRGLTRIFLSGLVAVSQMTCSAFQQSQRHSQKVVGAVVAYDRMLPLANITSAPQLQILVVRSHVKTGGKEEIRYFRVVYKRFQSEPDLPVGVFDGRRMWRFDLIEAPPEEDACKGPLHDRKRTVGSESTEVPDAAGLPCYLLRPDGVKTYTGKSKQPAS